MKDLQMFANECLNECDEAGIVYGNIRKFEINTRAKKRWGQCKLKNGVYTINISNRLLSDNIPDSSLKETIMHEILHTCKGCMNHGTEWKKMANKINNAYPYYNIKRCTSSEEKGVEVAEEKINYPYIYKCIGCGAIVRRQRASKFTKYPSLYKCGICGGGFSQIR